MEKDLMDVKGQQQQQQRKQQNSEEKMSRDYAYIILRITHMFYTFDAVDSNSELARNRNDAERVKNNSNNNNRHF